MALPGSGFHLHLLPQGRFMNQKKAAVKGTSQELLANDQVKRAYLGI
jgi:ABC-type lipopolysaccharide export system ATPase subunit